MKHLKILFAIIFISLSSCKKEEPISIDGDDLHSAIDNIVEIMVHDIFSPPVASRVFVYPNIAA